MITDGFTKGLALAKFQAFVKMLGLRTLKDSVAYAAVESRAMEVPRPAQVGLSIRHLPIRAINILVAAIHSA
ncbi:hypothetical protein GJ744_011588 [Endocarpon pusillum]|uniref:Uncharacterized protein n=1 Tax=Endocarpon pusillum TaxID=364733 RepID=A0A8H7DXT7_9EURO|nr:hypothetical protein GJ744_011588 [Endocarpon pusillum]